MHGPDLFVPNHRQEGSGTVAYARSTLMAAGDRRARAVRLRYSAAVQRQLRRLCGRVAEALDQRQAGHGATVVTVAGRA